MKSARQYYPQTDWGTPSRLGQRSLSDLRNPNGNENDSSLSKRLWGLPHDLRGAGSNAQTRAESPAMRTLDTYREPHSRADLIYADSLV